MEWSFVNCGNFYEFQTHAEIKSKVEFRIKI